MLYEVITVTGAGQGIGRGVAKTYAELGASVVVAEVNETAGSKVAEEINSNGGTSLFVPCDVRQEVDIIRLMAATHVITSYSIHYTKLYDQH